MTNTWGALREALLLIESSAYRGVSGMTFDNLISLVGSVIDPDRSMDRAAREAKARSLLKPAGGAMNCAKPFSPKIWKDWQANPNAALAKAATDSTKTSSQYPGEPRGGTVMKRNYGGRVVYQPGRRDQSHENRPSAMDTYDVLMRSDGQETLTRFAYAPAQGSFEERAARLEDLMSGREALPLKRRPQPEKPEPGYKTSPLPPADPVPRVGQNLQVNDPDKPAPPPTKRPEREPFPVRIAKISKAAQGRPRDDGDDEDEPLFPKKGK